MPARPQPHTQPRPARAGQLYEKRIVVSTEYEVKMHLVSALLSMGWKLVYETPEHFATRFTIDELISLIKLQGLKYKYKIYD